MEDISKNLSLEDLPGEIWKPITHFDIAEGHEVSNLGRVRSRYKEFNLENGKNFYIKERVKKQSSRCGYRAVRFTLKDGSNQLFRVHRIVGVTFLPIDNYLELVIHHKNFCRNDNRSDNLEWVTIAKNNRYTFLGTTKEYVKNNQRPIKEKIKLEIPKIFSCKYSLEGEIWRDVDGFKDWYQISNYGRVRSLDRLTIHKDGGNIYRKGKYLNPKYDSNGYLNIILYKYNKAYRRLLHRLVTLAFLENPNELKEVNHKNCNKSDNKLENLEWCSRQQNVRHAVENNLCDCNNGEGNPLSKLKNDDILRMRELRDKEHLSMQKLSRIFNTTESNISSILNRKTWKHI
jgi:hypothetical protein